MSKLRDPFESTLRVLKMAATVYERDNFARGVLNKFLYQGGLRFEVQLFTLLYTIFDRKRYPFCIPSIEKGYHFHIPFLELCIIFSCCRCTAF